jgi:hypothetical protein
VVAAISTLSYCWAKTEIHRVHQPETDHLGGPSKLPGRHTDRTAETSKWSPRRPPPQDPSQTESTQNKRLCNPRRFRRENVLVVVGILKGHPRSRQLWFLLGFGPVEAMIDRLCIATEGKVQFSAEEVLSCCTDCRDGCNGGYPLDAWIYWKNWGIVSGGDYKSQQGCQPHHPTPDQLSLTTSLHNAPLQHGVHDVVPTR